MALPELPQHLVICSTCLGIISRQKVPVCCRCIRKELPLAALLLVKLRCCCVLCPVIIVEQLYQPAERCQHAGPGVGAADCKQGALADLEGVVEALEEQRDLILHLAKGLRGGVEPLKQPEGQLREVLPRGRGEDLGGQRVGVRVCRGIGDDGADAAVEEVFVIQGPGVCLSIAALAEGTRSTWV